MDSIENSNIAETLARELKAPVEMTVFAPANVHRVALPQGWTMAEKDDEKYLAAPRRKVARVRLDDPESFVNYVLRHEAQDGNNITIWCVADYKAGKVGFIAILNDHGQGPELAAWRDHRATFSPAFSEEWTRWIGMNKKPFTQSEFAAFMEDNLQDIAGVENSPTGAQMLEMALNFEANQDMRYKSAIRLQNGGVQMSFVQDDDAQTLQKMQVFDRFSIGFPVFWNGDAYRIDARLRYRVRDGKLSFWYELIRADKVLEAAAQTLIAKIKGTTNVPFFFGNAFEI